MKKTQILGLIRHILTFGGGFLVDLGKITEPNLNNGIAFIMALIGGIWSYYAPEK